RGEPGALRFRAGTGRLEDRSLHVQQGIMTKRIRVGIIGANPDRGWAVSVKRSVDPAGDYRSDHMAVRRHIPRETYPFRGRACANRGTTPRPERDTKESGRGTQPAPELVCLS